MPYWLESDTFAVDPVWEVLSGRSADLVDQLQAAYCRLKATSAQVLSDGYLTEKMALGQCRNRPKLLALLTTAVLDGPPLLHRQGDECECLGEHWVPGYAYRIHGFSKRNPTRREYNRNRAQKADSRDNRLKHLVYTRDGGCCRYCLSGPLSKNSGRAKDPRKRIHYDHVDPDQPAGPNGENFVLSCKRCNEYKGHRLPHEADMVLHPAPTPERAAELRAHVRVLNEMVLVDASGNHSPIDDESTTNHHHDRKPVGDSIGERITDRDPDPIDDSTPRLRPTPSLINGEPMPNQPPEGSGLGRGGPRTVIGQPARSPEHPDVYHRRSRAAPEPEYVWPPGSVPADPQRPSGEP